MQAQNPSEMNTKLDEYQNLLNYLHQMPGLERAVRMGCQAVVRQYLTVVEMCESLNLYLKKYQVEAVDEAMSHLAEVMMMSAQSYRVSTVGGCSLQVREYPGCLFPLFLNVLSILGYHYDV